MGFRLCLGCGLSVGCILVTFWFVVAFDCVYGTCLIVLCYGILYGCLGQFLFALIWCCCLCLLLIIVSGCYVCGG